VTASHLEQSGMPRRRARFGFRHWRLVGAATGLLFLAGRPGDRSRALGCWRRRSPPPAPWGWPPVAEQIRTLQAAQAGQPMPAEPSAAEAAAPEGSRNLFRREGEYWTVCYDGAVVRLHDAKGLRHLA
jgi:hypothetical protein